MIAERKCCTECGEEKSLSDFHRNRSNRDGRDGRCKLCRVAVSKAWNAAHKDRIEAARDRYEARVPEKMKARKAIENAVRRGTIQRPDRCSACGRSGLIHAHHEDYSKPFTIEWLCSGCHGRRHGGDADDA